MNNQMLTAIFAVAGMRNGYDDIHAEFSPFRDFKIKWTRSYRWISFEVSDYLMDAPEDVMKSLANTIFRRIRGEDESMYTEPVRQWISSDQFVRSKQPLYVRRFRGLSMSTIGRNRDLAESYGRLVDMGLVSRDPSVYIGWAAEDRSRVIGRVSVLMKVVAMSSILDSTDVPDRVVDFCLYTQLAHLSMGFRPGMERRNSEYDALLSRFPDRASMEYELRRINMHYRGGHPEDGRCPPCANTPLHGPAMTPVSGH